jgi:hypothetical protein
MNPPHSALRTALLHADPVLSRYSPLERLLCVDRFEEGFHGWQTYFPDYDGTADYPGRHPDIDPLSNIRQQSLGQPGLRVDRKFPLGPRAIPMISSLTSWDVGTAGAWDSCYALKIPTLPQPGHKGLIVKRLGSPWRGKFRIETYFTYKAEPGDFRLGEADVHSFFLAFDVMESHAVKAEGRVPKRWWPAVRYLNYENGKFVGRWQANFTGAEGVMSGPWTDLPSGQQDLGFNRSPTKYQWHYLRLTFDLANRTYVDFRCADTEFDVAGRTQEAQPPLSPSRASTDHCPLLVNGSFGIETNSRKRCFLYLNSVVVSATEA